MINNLSKNKRISIRKIKFEINTVPIEHLFSLILTQIVIDLEGTIINNTNLDITIRNQTLDDIASTLYSFLDDIPWLNRRNVQLDISYDNSGFIDFFFGSADEDDYMTYTITLTSDWIRQNFAWRDGLGNDSIMLNYETNQENLLPIDGDNDTEHMSVDLGHLYLFSKINRMIIMHVK